MTTRDDTTDLRQRIADQLLATAEAAITAEWICCDPPDPHHDLCVQGHAALQMIRSLIVDDPDAAQPAPLTDAVLAVLAELAAPSPLRVRNAILRQTHEAIRTRFGILLPVCGIQVRNAVEAPAGSPVTCPFCNGTEKPIAKENP